MALLAAKTPELYEKLLAEREECINIINHLDQSNGKQIMNDAIQELLRKIRPLEERLLEKLTKEKQQAVSALQALKKEKTIKHQYGEQTFAASGIFYDKRK